MEDYLCWYAHGELFVPNESMEEQVVRSSVKKNVVEEDDNEIEECDEADDNNSIEDEDENSD